VARKSSSTAVQEELYPLPSDGSEHEVLEREPFDDARLVDLEAEQEAPFLRGQKRVSVRRGSLPKKTANRLMWVGVALVILAILGVSAAGLYDYGKHSWRFRIDSSDQIEVTGAEHVAHTQIMEIMGGDIGRNIFFVPLAQRKQQLEQIPWVESASVMRFVPNRLRIEIHERTPVAFARIGSHISLIDAGGTLMELGTSGKHKYSFAVIIGMNAGEPLSTRAARMKNYNQLVRELDSSGAHYSQELSEVDLSDPEDVKVIAADSYGDVLVHLGSDNYLQRYKTYVTHVQQWRQQFEKLESVDLRYDGQIIVNPELDGMARQPSLTPVAAKAAMAAGAKIVPVANYEKYLTHPAAPVPAKNEVKPKAKPVAHQGAVHHTPVKYGVAKVGAAKSTAAKSGAVKPAPPKQSSVNQAALRTQITSAPVASVKNTTPLRPAPLPTANPQPPPVAAPAGHNTAPKKPSAGILKETPQN
jgi:cell division protein FtsQ